MLPGSGNSDATMRTRPQHNTDRSENTFAVEQKCLLSATMPRDERLLRSSGGYFT